MTSKRINVWSTISMVLMVSILAVPILSVCIEKDHRSLIFAVIAALSAACLISMYMKSRAVEDSLDGETEKVRKILDRVPGRGDPDGKTSRLDRMVSTEQQKFMVLGAGVGIIIAFASLVLIELIWYKVQMDEKDIIAFSYSSIVSGMACSVVTFLRMLILCGNRLFVPTDRRWTELEHDAIEARVRSFLRLEAVNKDLTVGLVTSLVSMVIGIAAFVASFIELRFLNSPSDGDIVYTGAMVL